MPALVGIGEEVLLAVAVAVISLAVVFFFVVFRGVSGLLEASMAYPAGMSSGFSDNDPFAGTRLVPAQGVSSSATSASDNNEAVPNPYSSRNTEHPSTPPVQPPPDGDICSICHDTFALPCQTNCGHWYCAECFLRAWHHSSTLSPCPCPICRRSVTLLLPATTHSADAAATAPSHLHTQHEHEHRPSAPPLSASTPLSREQPSWNGGSRHDSTEAHGHQQQHQQHQQHTCGNDLQQQRQQQQGEEEAEEDEPAGERISSLDPTRRPMLMIQVANYNRLFGHVPTSLWQRLLDVPLLFSLLIRDLCNPSYAMRMLSSPRVVFLVAIVLGYVLSPFDLVPEVLLGVFGVFDDLMIVLMVGFYFLMAYRNVLLSRVLRARVQ